MEITTIDQVGNTLVFSSYPQRIVSVVPSQTELLADLGLGDAVVGITKFCVHPNAWFRTKSRVGGTKTLSIEKIRALQPDLLIANKEENTKEQIEALQQEFKVWISDIKDLDDALYMIREVGRILGKTNQAIDLSKTIELSFQALEGQTKTLHSAAYLIWNEPFMVAGGDTFISDMMRKAGLVNVFEKQVERYPTTSMDELKRLAPEFIFLSSEPFPFQEKHAEALTLELPLCRCVLVDGELFSWYGSRLLKTAAYLPKLTKNQ